MQPNRDPVSRPPSLPPKFPMFSHFGKLSFFHEPIPERSSLPWLYAWPPEILASQLCARLEAADVSTRADVENERLKPWNQPFALQVYGPLLKEKICQMEYTESCSDSLRAVLVSKRDGRGSKKGESQPAMTLVFSMNLRKNCVLWLNLPRHLLFSCLLALISLQKGLWLARGSQISEDSRVCQLLSPLLFSFSYPNFTLLLFPSADVGPCTTQDFNHSYSAPPLSRSTRLRKGENAGISSTNVNNNPVWTSSTFWSRLLSLVIVA